MNNISKHNQEQLARILEETGFTNLEAILKFDSAFAAAREALNSDLQLIHQASIFLSSLNNQLNDLIIALSGKRQMGSAITDFVDLIFEYIADECGIELVPSHQQNHFEFFKKKLIGFDAELWTKYFSQISEKDIEVLLEKEDDNGLRQLMEEKNWGYQKNEEEDQTEENAINDLVSAIDDLKGNIKEMESGDEKKAAQQQLREMELSVKNKKNESAARRRMEGELPRKLFVLLKSVRDMLLKAKERVLIKVSKPLLQITFRNCAQVVPLYLEFTDITSAVIEQSKQVLLLEK